MAWNGVVRCRLRCFVVVCCGLARRRNWTLSGMVLGGLGLLGGLWYVLGRFGATWRGSAWSGVVRGGSGWFGLAGVRSDVVWGFWRGLARSRELLHELGWFRVVWLTLEWSAMICRGLAWSVRRGLMALLSEMLPDSLK